MPGQLTNPRIAELLRKVSAAYLITGANRFRIIAYDRAADSIEHLTSEVKDYWDNGKLDEIPGVGGGIASYLDELFKTGRVRHWDDVLGKVPEAVYPLLLVPGIGPKKAYTLVRELKFNDAKTVVADLEKAAKAGKIAPIEGFGEKSESSIISAVGAFKRGQIKENRMPLPYADGVARELIAFLTADPRVVRADALGSLRRQVSTIGDIDIAAATEHPADVVKRFVTFPHQKIIDSGPEGATLLLTNGRQADVRVQKPDAYGAMLQYFTGSKHHNIQLRTMAFERGLSLSEHGIKDVKTGKIKKMASEESFYRALGLPFIPPELREDRGEIAAARRHALPESVTLDDIRGDLHIHSDYDLKPSHDLGKDSVSTMLSQAVALGYSYVGFSDHNPKVGGQSEKEIIDIMKRRKDKYEQLYSSWIQKVSGSDGSSNNKATVHYFLMCEVDILPDGNLALPDAAFEFVDAAVVSVHSAFTQPKHEITKRIIAALTAHPKVRILGHPTARLLGKREGIDADWPQVFETAKAHDIALEINAYPDRLDLPDALVYDARKMGLRFTIDTDAHAADQMTLMRYGVSVARRGWAEKSDILNALGYNDFKRWLLRS